MTAPAISMPDPRALLDPSGVESPFAQAQANGPGSIFYDMANQRTLAANRQNYLQQLQASRQAIFELTQQQNRAKIAEAVGGAVGRNKDIPLDAATMSAMLGRPQTDAQGAPTSVISPQQQEINASIAPLRRAQALDQAGTGVDKLAQGGMLLSPGSLNASLGLTPNSLSATTPISTVNAGIAASAKSSPTVSITTAGINELGQPTNTTVKQPGASAPPLQPLSHQVSEAVRGIQQQWAAKYPGQQYQVEMHNAVGGGYTVELVDRARNMVVEKQPITITGQTKGQ